VSPRLRLLILLAVALPVGLAALRAVSVDGPIGGNDRSRWLTVRAVTETGSLSIGARVAQPGGHADSGLLRDKGWQSEDIVLHPETGRFYSSKPPLLSLFVVGPTRLVASLTGADLRTQPAPIVRGVLLLVNVLSLALALAALAMLGLRAKWSPFTQVWMLLALGLGTPTLAYVAVLNNHVPAVAAVTVAAVMAWMIVVEDDRRPFVFLAAGLFASAAAALEQPAMMLLVAVAIALYACDPRRTLLFALPAALFPLVCFFGANALALGDPRPAYLLEERWFVFPGSYWAQARGVDAATDGPLAYAFHFLVGHHGFFLLSPVLVVGAVAAVRVWDRSELPRPRLLLSLVAVVVVAFFTFVGKGTETSRLALGPLLAAMGVALFLYPAPRHEDADARRLFLSRLALASVLPAIAFYVGDTRNYGGTTVAARWLLWTTPLLLLAAAPLVDAWRSRAARALTSALLVLSVLSTLAMGADPWREPWTLREAAPAAPVSDEAKG
jgi:hypothetical protein